MPTRLDCHSQASGAKIKTVASTETTSRTRVERLPIVGRRQATGAGTVSSTAAGFRTRIAAITATPKRANATAP